MIVMAVTIMIMMTLTTIETIGEKRLTLIRMYLVVLLSFIGILCAKVSRALPKSCSYYIVRSHAVLSLL